jgi:hypothetical protein
MPFDSFGKNNHTMLFARFEVSKRIESRSQAFVNGSHHDTLLRRGVSTSPNPHNGAPFHVGCLQPLVQYLLSYPPYWRPLLHPQPEDAPYHGDRDPLIMLTTLRNQDGDR